MSGYVYLTAPRDHPLRTRASEYVGEHRIVLFDKIGPGSHPCHWCARPLAWHPKPGDLALVTDHLDDIRNNNDPENIVASCIRCNSWRARWPESFARFIDARQAS